MDFERRELVKWVVLPLGLAFSGCVADFPAGRVLDIWNIEANRSNSSLTLNVTVRARNTLEPGGFHDVEVVGYSNSGEVLCSEYVGDLAVGTESAEQTITLECNTMPNLVVVTAEETPCDEDTYIEFREYSSSEGIWEPIQWRCGENPFRNL